MTGNDPCRQLMIKTKACQRLQKEVLYYQREVAENQEKLDQMKTENKNPYDIKKFQEVLDESHMMVPDSQRRLDQALQDLKSFLLLDNESTSGNAIEISEWYGPAKELIDTLDGGMGTADIDGVVEETDVSNLKDGEAF